MKEREVKITERKGESKVGIRKDRRVFIKLKNGHRDTASCCSHPM